MFKPDSNINVSKIWESLGTFFNYLSQADKQPVEQYWQSFIDTAEAAFYNLFQANLSQYFKYTPGYIEHKDEQYDVIFKDKTDQGRENTKIIYLHAPENITVSNNETGTTAYSYKVTAVNDRGETLPSNPAITISGNSDLSIDNNSISWTTVSGATHYNLYGRTQNNEEFMAVVSGLSFNDTGSITPSGILPTSNTAERYWIFQLPENRDYMSIPTLSGLNTGQVLEENVDYQIENLDKLKFLYLPDTKDATSNIELREEFIAASGISLIPAITRFYLPSLGIEFPKRIIASGLYTPKIDGWSGKQYFNKRKDYCRHLKYLMYASISVLRKEPTMKNLKHAYSLFRDFPFSYEQGQVTDITSDIITISGVEGVFSYKTGSVDFLYSVGEDIEQFDILISGIHFDDYISNSALVSGQALKHGEPGTYDVFIEENTPTTDKLDILTTFNIQNIEQSDKIILKDRALL